MNTKTLRSVTSLTTLLVTLFSTSAIASRWTTGFQEGKAPIQSISQLAFGPEGILFIADSKGAAVVAIETQKESKSVAAPIRVEALNQKLAALLGCTPDQLLIEDLAVHPITHQAYIAVSRGRGPEAVPVLVRVGGENKLELVALDHVRFSKANLPDAPADAPPAEGRRGGNPRLEAITDIAFLEDRVLVAGLSNEEFASSLRVIPFPFQNVAKGTSVEMYHGAHGRFETRAPIRTFVPFNIGNQPHLLAAYTCTPLVQLPLKDLLPGAKIQGKTIAELGNRNRPLDMIVYEKAGKEYLLLANSSRGVMKVSTDGIESAEGIREPVKDGGTRGLKFETVAGWTGILQLDRLDASQALVVRHTDSGQDNLESLPLP